MSDWNTSFMKQYWRCLHSGEASVGQQNWTAGIPLKQRTTGEHSFPSSLLGLVTLTNTYISNTYTCKCADEQIFFKVTWSVKMTLLVPGEKCQLGFSPKSCTYPTLVTIDPLGVKIVSILVYKNDNCPTLFCTFTTDNSSFRTIAKKKMFCVSIFLVKEFLIYKFKLLSLLKRLYSMSSTMNIHDPLPVTLWRHSVTQTWPTKPLQHLGMKL